MYGKKGGHQSMGVLAARRIFPAVTADFFLPKWWLTSRQVVPLSGSRHSMSYCGEKMKQG
jgi:hypothetical protein